MVKFFALINLIGLVCGITGSVLLLFSFTLRPSNYSLTETSDHRVAICLNGRVVASGYGGPLGVTDEGCPEGGVAPVIEADRPAFARWGLRLILLGFALQVPSALLPFRRDN
jgi:hypothetical protein